MANEINKTPAKGNKDAEEKPSPSPKQRKGKNDQGGKPGMPGAEGKPKKKKGKFLKIFIILLLLAAITTVVLWFLKILPDPTGYWEWKDYQRNSSELDDREAAVEQKETELDQRESDLDTRESAVEEKETALDSSTSTSSSTVTGVDNSDDFESMLSGLSDDKITEIKKLATIYSKMDATSAAGILAGMYSNDDIALIIYYMTPASAAEVLAKMDAELAASITTLVVR